jgi:hypothetical protein
MHQMRGAYVTRELVPRSIPLLGEMMNVVQDGSTIGAPESSNVNLKDDRVFGAALALRAWINWRRPEMMAQNLTYQTVTDEETGATSARARSLNGLVNRYFQWQQVLDEERVDADGTPSWRADRGLT